MGKSLEQVDANSSILTLLKAGATIRYLHCEMDMLHGFILVSNRDALGSSVGTPAVFKPTRDGMTDALWCLAIQMRSVGARPAPSDD